ncbi:MAG TPA: glycosyltransferase family 2 protein [Candidatus Paceibacterota bacterium]|nr:glycosyltransferase family 2 protein [Candidatus Paceibacterota bacterium]
MKDVVIQMAVHNGGAWLRPVLESVAAQTYPAIRVILTDNASTDDTADIARSFPGVKYVRNEENAGFWTAQEAMFGLDSAPYIVCLTDVVLEPGFISAAVAAMEQDGRIGAVQGRILQMEWRNGRPEKSDLVDALGFRITRSRRVTIAGHGEKDDGSRTGIKDVFAVEGAVPVFRRSAVDDCRIDGRFADTDYRVGSISYNDDVDMGWRMNLFGWRQVLVNAAVGWHDRSTTKGVARTPVLGQLARRRQRAAIPLAKRRLDWVNGRFTLVKNDHIINILKDAPYILVREAAVQGYALLFEPRVLAGWGRFFRLLPRMLARRKRVMARAKRTPGEIRTFLTA